MAQPKKWIDEITEVVASLGGKASLSDIYNRIEDRDIMNLHRTWTASVRRTIESYSSDCEAFYGKEDIFYSVEGKGKGVWGLRSPYYNAERQTNIAVAVTDYNWFDFLRNDPSKHIINFWTPTPWNLRKLRSGDKLYFMLKSPIRKVGGFGYLKYYENMKIETAWHHFGKGNGVNDLNEFYERCSLYNEEADSNSDIGCIVLENPVFLSDSDFFAPSEYGFDFPDQIVKYKYFNTDLPIEVEPATPLTENFIVISEDGVEYGNSRSKKRTGQGGFRNKVLQAYSYKCAVSGETCEEVLQASHIQPYVNDESNHIQNGICLRMDIHKLFDEGLISINEEYEVITSTLLKDSSYSVLNKQKIFLPKDKNFHPSQTALKLHRNIVFRD